MKITKLILFIFCSLLVACGDDDNNATASIEEFAIITNSEVYEFEFGIYSDESIIEIQQHPINFISSEIIYDQSNQKAYYIFQPISNYVGMEIIKIFYQNIDGTSAEHYLTIEINVTG